MPLVFDIFLLINIDLLKYIIMFAFVSGGYHNVKGKKEKKFRLVAQLIFQNVIKR